MKNTWLLKISILLVPLFLILFGCAAAPPAPEKAPEPPEEPVPYKIYDVGINRKIFNPSKGEHLTISFRVSRPFKGFVRIFDPEMKLVRELFSENAAEDRLNNVVWDGKDEDGMEVPDEAYMFTIDAGDFHGNFAFYDPTVSSGGRVSFPGLNSDRQKQVVSYQLDNDSRVNIRAGIKGGALLTSIVYWSPRIAGRREEPWDGSDASGVIDIVGRNDTLLRIEAVSLPENSIFTSGATAYDYFTYKRDIAPQRPEKKKRPRQQNQVASSIFPSSMPAKMGPEPRFRMELPRVIKSTDNGLPVVRGKTPIRILLDETIKRQIIEERFEVLFFVDHKFVTELEEGYSPITFMWDTRKHSNAEHVITINVVTLTGWLSSGSMKVVVKN
jgi:hypothetical protein